MLRTPFVLTLFALTACGGSDDASADATGTGTAGTAAATSTPDTSADGATATDDSGQTGTGTDGATETGNDTTTGDPPVDCEGDEDCTEGTAVFCGGAGVCVDCGGVVDGDAACAGLGRGTDVCSDGACGECTADNDDGCGGNTPGPPILRLSNPLMVRALSRIISPSNRSRACRPSNRLYGSVRVRSARRLVDWRYVAEVTISRCIALRLHLTRINSVANQSSNA